MAVEMAVDIAAGPFRGFAEKDRAILQLKARIAAALQIHRPCHSAATEPWCCEHGHADEACTTGIPDVPAVCMQCTDAADDHLLYPCPTARALLGQSTDGDGS
jgi:hypothetical protein